MMEYQNIDQSDISLLYPDEQTLADSSAVLSRPILSEYDAEQLELGVLLDLKSCEVSSFLTSDPAVILYRQQTFRDTINNPELCTVLKKMIPLLSDITELRKLENDTSLSTESYLYSITEVELYI